MNTFSGVENPQETASPSSSEAPQLTGNTKTWPVVAQGKALLLLTVSAVALGQANCFGVDGFEQKFDFITFTLLTLSLIAGVLSLLVVQKNAVVPLQTGESRGLEKLLRIVPSLKRFSILHPVLLGLWLLFLIWQVINASISILSVCLQLKVSVAPAPIFGTLAFVGIIWSMRSHWGWWLQLITFVGVATWLIAQRSSPLDVFVFQHDACAALLHGHNPYAMTFRNLYPDNSPYYGAGMSQHGRLQFGYVYMPLTLILTLPGFLLGDVRFSQVVAIALSALFIAGLRPRAEKALLGALFLWSPVVFFVSFLSWTDPFCVLTLCFVFFCTRRRPSWLPLACGLFLVSKQYALLALPLLWLLAPLTTLPTNLNGQSSTRSPMKPNSEDSWATFWRFLGKTLTVSALVTLPLALWNFHAFFYSTMQLQFHQPFRRDSLSFMAIWFNLSRELLPWWLPFGLTLLTLIWTLRRMPRNEAGFLAAMSLVFLVFFAFNKQAFVNYYYFVIGALWCTTMAVFERSMNARTASTTQSILATEMTPQPIPK